MAQFEFNNQLLPQSLLDVDDIGQCAIEGSNDEGMFYYMLIRTSLGTTTIATCGPIVPDVEFLPNGFQESLKRIGYKEDKITKEIGFFLNDTKKKLTDAKVMTFEDALKCFRDLKDYLMNYGWEVY